MAARNKIVKAYLEAYKGLVVSEPIVDKSAAGESVTLSLPLHFAGNHRVEVTVTEFSPGKFMLSDMARTLSELTEASRRPSEFRRRAEEISRKLGVRVHQDYLLLESDAANLGKSIQRFAEAAKTVGDAYLLQQSERPVHQRAVVSEVKEIFRARHLIFQEDQKLPGEIEPHEFQLYVPPNGRPGIAVAFVGGESTHALAKIWTFNCNDIRVNFPEDRLKLAIVYDEASGSTWSESSQKILRKSANIVSASGDLSVLEHQMILQGVAA
jgi:hypothetical protein